MKKERLRLSEDGYEFLTCLRTVLDWLAMGGEILAGGQRVAMTEDAMPGIVVTESVGSQMTMLEDKKEMAVERFILINSDVVWQSIVSYAKGMSFSEHMIMAGDVAINQMSMKKVLQDAQRGRENVKDL